MTPPRFGTALVVWLGFIFSPPLHAEVVAGGYLKASNTGSYDHFGTAVAVSGDTMVVGAPREGSNATGVNGNAFNNLAMESGAAYVFVRDGETWTQQAYLKASNTGAGDQFGWAVAIDGDTIVVGALLEDSAATGVDGDGTGNAATNAGAAYVFVRDGTGWSQQACLKASNANAAQLFGSAVSVSGESIVVGANREASQATGVNGGGADSLASNSGAAYVFSRDGESWSQQAYLKASDTAAGAEFGSAVGISGDTVVIGAPSAQAYTGAVYVFSRGDLDWTQQARLTAANGAPFARFGQSVAVSASTLAVGARGESSAATGVNGDPADTSAPDAGAVYVFNRGGAVWTQEAYLKASNTGAADYFGKSVALDGNQLVVGAHGEDSSATGIDGAQDGNAAGAAGAAYCFRRSSGAWSQQGYLKASNTGAGDWFGGAVAVSGDTVLVGASRESGGSTGVNGAQGNNNSFESGAAYGFSLPPQAAAEILVMETGGGEMTDGAGVAVFPPSATGVVMTKTFLVANQGDAALQISSYLLDGANAGDFTVDASGMPDGLPGGSQGILRIHFNGASSGDYEAALRIVSNDADESPFDIGLSASAWSVGELFDEWAAAAGLGGGTDGHADTPFGDGVANLLKFAFNMAGSGPDLSRLHENAGLPVFQVVRYGSQDYLRVDYLRRKGSGLNYTAKVSDGMSAGSFAPMAGSTTVTDLDGQWERVRIDQPRDLTTQPRGFGIVEVTMP